MSPQRTVKKFYIFKLLFFIIKIIKRKKNLNTGKAGKRCFSDFWIKNFKHYVDFLFFSVMTHRGRLNYCYSTSFLCLDANDISQNNFWAVNAKLK